MNLTPDVVTTAMKRMNRDNLRSSAVVQEQVPTTQPGAGIRNRWVDRFPRPLPCRVSAPRAGQTAEFVGSKVDLQRLCLVIFEDTAAVRLSDRFSITTESGSTVMCYPVGDAFPRDGEVMRKVMCEVRDE